MKTIPLYNGCSNIGDFFNEKGIIKFSNVDDLIFISNTLTEEYYIKNKEIIKEKYQKALSYLSYEKSIIYKIQDIFKLNNLWYK